MRFGYHATMCNPDYYHELAIAAEGAGFNSFTLADSICYHKEADSKYPYNMDGSREFLDGVPFIEPFSLIPWMAAVTRKIKFTTSVLKLPIRNPVLVAKSVTSLASLIGDRLILGVGLSPWKEDFDATGTDWDSRGKRMDEMLEIMRGLATGDYFEFNGTHYTIPAIKLCPVPNFNVPILAGGHSAPALRRAGRQCDGWSSANASLNELGDMISTIAGHRAESERSNQPFYVQATSAEAYTLDGIKRLEDLAVDEVLVGFRNAYEGGPDNRTLDHMLAEIDTYANGIIAKA